MLRHVIDRYTYSWSVTGFFQHESSCCESSGWCDAPRAAAKKKDKTQSNDPLFHIPHSYRKVTVFMHLLTCNKLSHICTHTHRSCALPPGHLHLPGCSETDDYLGCSSYQAALELTVESNLPEPQTCAVRTQTHRQAMWFLKAACDVCRCFTPNINHQAEVSNINTENEDTKETFTMSSFSAVGLFFGFFVRAILTKLWKAVDLQEKLMFRMVKRANLFVRYSLNMMTCTQKWVRNTHHLFLSFNLGGWKLLLDIKNKALQIQTDR